MEDLTERRRVVITGASSGIGQAAAVELARRGNEVVLVGRDPARLTAAAQDVRQASGRAAALFRADFAVLDDVRRLADGLRATYDRIDVLANNAGAIVLRPVTTVDGHELTMQANHLAPFLLSHLLADRLGRIVTTSSGAHRSGALDPDRLAPSPARYRPMRTYGTSKQANILFAAEAGRRWPHLVSVSFHPGLVRTRFFADSRLVSLGMRIAPFLRSPERGADTLVWLSTEPESDLVNGGYYVDRRVRRPAAGATDPQVAARLWSASCKAVGVVE